MKCHLDGAMFKTVKEFKKHVMQHSVTDRPLPSEEKRPTDASMRIATEVIATRFRLDTPAPAALRLIDIFANALDERFTSGEWKGYEKGYQDGKKALGGE